MQSYLIMTDICSLNNLFDWSKAQRTWRWASSQPAAASSSSLWFLLLFTVFCSVSPMLNLKLVYGLSHTVFNVKSLTYETSLQIFWGGNLLH